MVAREGGMDDADSINLSIAIIVSADSPNASAIGTFY
jgi:hypothetical protein